MDVLTVLAIIVGVLLVVALLIFIIGRGRGTRL